MQHTYGILDRDQCHIDVSSTERGAKNYATRNGYKAVSVRYNCGYNVRVIAVKNGKKWERV
jgi:plastocyanin domain-containing protein